jgi:hypothetical protein
LAKIQFDFEVPRAIGMFGCGLLLMGFIELLLWLISGEAPDGAATVVHPLMGLLVCGSAEFFRTDGRHSPWRAAELLIGLTCAALAMLACAVSGLRFIEPSLGNAGFVLVMSLIAAMMVLFLVVGVLAMAAHALELLLRRLPGADASP